VHGALDLGFWSAAAGGRQRYQNGNCRRGHTLYPLLMVPCKRWPCFSRLLNLLLNNKNLTSRNIIFNIFATKGTQMKKIKLKSFKFCQIVQL